MLRQRFNPWFYPSVKDLQRLMTSPGTIQDNVFNPPGFTASSNPLNASILSGNTYFYYLGRAQMAYSTFQIRYFTNTIAVAVSWAEVGIAVGTPVVGGGTTLTRRGYANLSTGILNLGAATTSVSAQVMVGEYFWVGFGVSSLVSIGAFQGGIADAIQSGTRQTYAGRLSTMPNNQATTLSAANHVPIACVAIAS